VKALRKVLRDPFISSTKGSLMGYLRLPHRTECSCWVKVGGGDGGCVGSRVGVGVCSGQWAGCWLDNKQATITAITTQHSTQHSRQHTHQDMGDAGGVAHRGAEHGPKRLVLIPVDHADQLSACRSVRGWVDLQRRRV